MKFIAPAFLSLFLTALPAYRALANSNDAMQSLSAAYATEYEGLNIPDLQLGYVENLSRIQDLDGIERQSDFFRHYKSELRNIDRRELTTDLQIQYDVLKYEVHLNLERLALEKDFRQHPQPNPLPTTGLYHLPHGREWYRYFVKRWTSKEMSPSEAFTFGLWEVERVSKEITKIQNRLEYGGRDKEFYAFLNSPNFFITDQNQLITELKDLREKIHDGLNRDFEITEIPEVDIQPIAHPNKDTPPGYYSDGTFYFNFYGQKFRKRTMQWLFLHEAIPGHHYQSTLASESPNKPPFAKFLWYPGYSEGWGAYSEDIGRDLGVYQDIYQQLGKWEWDLVRSARLVLDVGLNDRGWSRERALKFWHDNIPNQDDIAEREVDRMIRWPAQVASYKVGEHTILTLKRKLQQALGSAFDIRSFHSLILQRGPLPLDVLENVSY